MKLHHLGVACSDIRETLEKMTRLFSVTSVSEIIFDPAQDAELCMVSIKDSSPIELIAGPVVAGLVKKNLLLYHTCWEVDDIDQEIARMCAEGCTLISEPKPAVLFEMQRVAFLATPAGIVELLEFNSATLASSCVADASETGGRQP